MKIFECATAERVEGAAPVNSIANLGLPVYISITVVVAHGGIIRHIVVGAFSLH